MPNSRLYKVKLFMSIDPCIRIICSNTRRSNLSAPPAFSTISICSSPALTIKRKRRSSSTVLNGIPASSACSEILEDCSRDEFFGNPDARQPRTKEFLNKILQH